MPVPARVSTGIPGLDEVLCGGLFRSRCYLIVGAAGTGKTLTSIQWLLDGVRQGEKCLFISLSETADELAHDVGGFEWDLDQVEVLNLNPLHQQPAGQERHEEYTLFPPSDVEQQPTWERLYEAVEARAPDRVVIDSMSQLRFLSTDDYQFRKQLLHLVAYLRRQRVTALLTYEASLHEEDPTFGLSVDGILHLRMHTLERRIMSTRDVSVHKLRGSDFISGHHSLKFTKHGLRIFPHRIEEPGTRERGGHLPTGSEALDELMGGGLEQGTTTLLTGPPGVGKSTLSMQMLREAVRSGERAVVYAFEEAADSIQARCRSLGLPVDDLVESGQLRILRVNPPAVSPDEFLFMLRHAVEEDGRTVVLLDSLRGYELAMEAYPSPLAHLYNLITYLGRQGVTALLVEEVEQLAREVALSAFSLTYMVDNVLVLRYVEAPPRILKGLACLKKRHGPFEASVRELRIGPEGIDVTRPLDHLHGFLSGAPAAVAPPSAARSAAPDADPLPADGIGGD